MLTYIPFDKLSYSWEEDLTSIWSDSEVLKYTNINSPLSHEEIHKRVERFKTHDVFAVFEDKKLIGVIGCPAINKEKHEFGIFYQFKKSSWGKNMLPSLFVGY